MIHPGVIAGSPKGVTVYVYDSGTPAIHGTYIEAGIYNGLPQYNSIDVLRMIAYIDGGYRICNLGDYDKTHAYYYDKNENALTPWDVEAWQPLNGSAPPATVSLTPSPPEPIAMNISGSGSGVGLPVDVPVIGELNGKPSYFIESIGGGVQDQYEIKWEVEPTFNGGNPVWQVRIKAGFSYWSAEDVPYPSDVTAWNISSADPPLPTVTAVY